MAHRLYSMCVSFVSAIACASIFSERSTPITARAPRSHTYRQCHPNPQPRSRTHLPAKFGSNDRNAGHSPAPPKPSTDRAIWLYLPKNEASSYLFCFIVDSFPIVPRRFSGLSFFSDRALSVFSRGG